MAAAEKRGVADRTQALAGELFEEVQAADLYLLRFVLHDWRDAKAAQILASATGR